MRSATMLLAGSASSSSISTRILATPAADQIERPRRFQHGNVPPAQHLISDCMAVGVVDGLEVDVDQQQGQMTLLAGAQGRTAGGLVPRSRDG